MENQLLDWFLDYWKNLGYLVKNELWSGACGQSWKWRLRESESTKVTQQEMDRNGIQIACLCDSRVLALAIVSAFNQGLCLPAVTGGAQSCLVSWFISGVPFSEIMGMIFTIIKGKFILSLENFSRSIWGSLIKANERKIVCVCVCVCVWTFLSVVICLQFLLSPYWLIPTWY